MKGKGVHMNCPLCGRMVGTFNSFAYRCTSCGVENICEECIKEVEGHFGYLCPACAQKISASEEIQTLRKKKETQERDKIRLCKFCQTLYKDVTDSENICPHCRNNQDYSGAVGPLTNKRGELLKP